MTRERLVPLAKKLSLEFGGSPRPTVRRITRRIQSHQGFVNTWAAGRGWISIAQVTPQMAPAAGAPRTWEIPEILTLGEHAETLRLHPDDLGWLISHGQTEHYRHRWHAKPKSGRFRLIEAPKVLLYADDRLFSGGLDFARQARRFEVLVGAIMIEEGFRPNHHKTRVLRQGQKQHAAGLVLNGKPNIDRSEFDRLKAILTNCARHGPASQNRECHPDFAAHLAGKLALVSFIHPGKGAKLRATFKRIEWE